MPSEGVRTIVSFLLFVHLFALVVGIIAANAPAEFERAIAENVGLRHYLRAVGMDLPYTYYFTRGNDPGGELDIDYAIEATIKREDGEAEVVRLPADDARPHQRFHRYQKLAQQLASYAREDAPEPDDLERLAQAIALGLLQQHDAQALDLRCRGRLTPPTMDEYRPETYTDRYRDAYDAHAFLWDDRVELIKKEPARDTAPPPKDN